MTRPVVSRLLQVVWWLLLVASLGTLVADRWGDLVVDGLSLPDWASVAGVSGLMAAYAWALAERIGIMPRLAAVLSGAAAAGALLSERPEALAGTAVALTVVTSVLAVMLTTPARGLVQVVREVLVASLVSAVGGLGVAGIGASLTPGRFEYVSLGLALVWALLVVNALGAGLHGLGRRGLITVVAATLLIVLAVAYGELLSRYGSPGLVRTLEDLRRHTVDALLVVPHPLAALLGYPALAWGTFTRARRRQGWWVTAFGVAATTSTTTVFVDAAPLSLTLLATGYSIVVGVVIGALVIRADQFLTGPRGSRARRVEEAAALRPEPRRGQSLR